jgi:hypothetical protein
MIEGVTDKPTLTGLGLGKRSIVRLGALLSRGVACTEALLESAERGSALEKLLLSARLMEAAAKLDTALLADIAAEAGISETLVVVEAPPNRVIALEEELEADSAWSDSERTEQRQLTALANAPSLMPSASADQPSRAELFSPAEIEKLKLTALTSARADEAISALRQLAYAPIPADERGGVFVRALAILDSQVRAEAARLLAGVGLSPEVSESLTSLAAGNDAEKGLAIDRLGKALAARSTDGGEADLVLVSSLVALTSALSAEHSVPIRGHVLSSLAGAAAVLASFPQRLAEVLRRVVELLVADHGATVSGALELLDALRREAPAQLDALLRSQLQKTNAAQVRALLLGHLAALARQEPDEHNLAEVCELLAAEFSGGGQSASDRQTLGAELMRMPADMCVPAILDRFSAAELSAQRSFLRILADVARYRQISDPLVERIGQAFLKCLQSAAKQLRLGVFETLLPCDPRLSAQLRASLASAYIENFSDLVFKPDIELAENSIARMGLPALGVLLERMEPSWLPQDRVRACRIIGEMGRLAASGKLSFQTGGQEFQDATRKLLQTSAEEFPDPGCLAVAMGKLTGTIHEDPAALETVWHRVTAMELSEASRLEALSWAASAPAATLEMAEAATKALLLTLAAPEPESLGEVNEVRSGAERTLALSAEASDFVSTMPAVVRGLARVALAPAAIPTLRSRVLTALTNRWKDLVSGRCIWGPAAATTMIEGLRDLACHQSSRPEEKLEVIRALGLRMVDPPAMAAIAEVLAVDHDSPALAGPAASAALALLAMRDKRGRFPEEDRQHIVGALTRILTRKNINVSTRRTAKLRERIAEELYEAFNDSLPGAYESMCELAACESLPTELREEVSARLKARHSLAASDPK